MVFKISFSFMILLISIPYNSFSQEAVEIKQYPVKEAKQAVAVDKNNFYIINNSSIVKYKKSDGTLVGQWDGAKMGVRHLNSGVVIKDKLYCANSNFPTIPMVSSVEIINVKTLQHAGNHSFGIAPYGSLTWIDYKKGKWWAGFAQYGGKDASEGKNPSWTTIVRFNKYWQQEEAWIFPGDIVKAFGTRSNSGGAWANDDLLYCTGHDAPELYVMKEPETGYTLQHISTIPVPIQGQGIAIDHSVKNRLIIYGIKRANNTISVVEIK
jgi:hypothetical protein